MYIITPMFILLPCYYTNEYYRNIIVLYIPWSAYKHSESQAFGLLNSCTFKHLVIPTCRRTHVWPYKVLDFKHSDLRIYYVYNQRNSYDLCVWMCVCACVRICHSAYINTDPLLYSFNCVVYAPVYVKLFLFDSKQCLRTISLSYHTHTHTHTHKRIHTHTCTYMQQAFTNR